jgi:type IV pilus assembly protein PilO
MRTIKEARRHFLLLLGLLLAVALGSAAVLFSPMGRASRTGPQRLAQLLTELRVKEHENVPLRGIDEKVATAKEQIGNFYQQRLPVSYAAISEELGKVVGETGVQMSAGRYSAEGTEVPGVQRILVDTSITGNYLQAVKFVNAMEREKMFFLIDSVALGREQAAGNVQLNMRMETYLRTGERKTQSADKAATHEAGNGE